MRTCPKLSQQRAVDDYGRGGFTRSRFIPRAIVDGPLLRFFPPDGPWNIEVTITAPQPFGGGDIWIIRRRSDGAYFVGGPKTGITATVPFLDFQDPSLAGGASSWTFYIGPHPASLPLMLIPFEQWPPIEPWDKEYSTFAQDRCGAYCEWSNAAI